MSNDPYKHSPIPWSDLPPNTYWLIVATIAVTVVVPRILWSWGTPGWVLVVLNAVLLSPLLARPSLARAGWLLLGAIVAAMLVLPFATTQLSLSEALAFDAKLHGKNVVGIAYLYAVIANAFVSAIGWVLGFKVREGS